MIGRAIRAKGKTFSVLSDGIEYQCEVLGKAKQRKGKTPVAVGDKVDFTFEGDGPGGIEYVHPRNTKFSRPKVGKEESEQVIAANIDQMVIVVSVGKPKFKQHLIDRFTVAALLGGLESALVINKIDLKHDLDLDHITSIYESLEIPVLRTSSVEKKGINQLRELLKDKESIFVGHSGVGKSSLLNQIQPGLKLKTKDISEATNKGTHSTTSVELYPLDTGGFVVDTPGLKILGIWDIEKGELENYFPEFQPYLGHCKFSLCSHTHEPQCAVKQAVEKGEIFSERYVSYQRIYTTL